MCLIARLKVMSKMIIHYKRNAIHLSFLEISLTLDLEPILSKQFTACKLRFLLLFMIFSKTTALFMFILRLSLLMMAKVLVMSLMLLPMTQKIQTPSMAEKLI